MRQMVIVLVDGEHFRVLEGQVIEFIGAGKFIVARDQKNKTREFATKDIVEIRLN